MTRDGSKFKLANELMRTLEDHDGLADDLNQDTEDWREQVLIKAAEISSNEEPPPQMDTDAAKLEVAEQPTTVIQPEQPTKAVQLKQPTALVQRKQPATPQRPRRQRNAPAYLRDFQT